MTKILSNILLVLALCLGCQSSRLEIGGSYAPGTNGVSTVKADMPLFVVDSAFDLAYSTIDATFKFERDNRLLLWKISPNIKHTLDVLRPQALKVAKEYLLVRAVYKNNPVPANLTALQSVLLKMQQLSVAAQAALPSK